MGLSFAELNMLTLDDYVTFIEQWLGDESGSGCRRATQADIDRMLG